MSDQHVGHTEVLAYAENRVNLSPADAQKHRDQVNALRERLAARIRDDPEFALVKMLHAGSVAKGTALSSVNDMDVAVYVRKSVPPTDESEMLEWLADRLREANPQLKPDQFEMSDHCVRVSFRGSGLDVDVVPVLYEDDPDDLGYLLSRDTGDWLLTSIPLHLEFIRKRKSAQPKHFAQVIRLIKWWVRRQKQIDESFRFKSFMVELTCARLADDGCQMSNYPTALEEFYSYLVRTEFRERIVFTDNYQLAAIPKSDGSPIQVFDPVNPENNVAQVYTDLDRRRIVEAANDALDALTEARYADTKGRTLDDWKDVLGPSFSA